MDIALATLADRQLDTTARALAAVRPFLGGPEPAGDGWRFDLRPQLESNWGAVYGGATAAGMLAVARAVAPDRSPRSLHLQLVRAVPAGAAYATATLRHTGRTVATVEVELHDHRHKLAGIALLTMITPDAVQSQWHDTTATPPIEVRSAPPIPGADTASWDAPIVRELRLGSWVDGELGGDLAAENARPSVDGTKAAASTCTIPWDDLTCTGPEAACLMADSIVAYPVMRSFIPLDAIGPNADLTLRFTTAPATRILTAASSVLSVQHGTATVGIEVQAGDQQLAHGLATSLLPSR